MSHSGNAGNAPAIPEAARATLLGDPQWLLFDLLALTQEALWLRLTPEMMASASFLDQRILPQVRDKLKTPWAILDEVAVDSSRPLRWIFHCGHAGSTLLSRLLQVPGYRVLREPQVLRSLSTLYSETQWPWSPRSEPQWWQQLAAPALNLLSRHARDEQGVLIKATSATSNLMPAVLEQRRQDRAVALAMPLDLYLAAMLRSPAATHDILGFAPARYQQFCHWLGQVQTPLWQLSREQTLAMSWLVTVWPMAQAIQAFPERCSWLDFGQLMADTDAATVYVAERLSWGKPLPASSETGRYAKDPSQPFDAGKRWRELSAARAAQAENALALLDWLAEICTALPILQAFIRNARGRASIT